MLEIYNGPLNVENIFERWHLSQHNQNYGAFITFVGTVRQEGGITALSFDLYEPILRAWFDGWQRQAKEKGALLCMAHSSGDVPVHNSSFMAAVFSSKRAVALELIEAFVEDFKKNAPIWKYDLVGGQRVYARDRSTPIEGSGLLAMKR